MKEAISQLKVNLSVLENNEPINRAEGNTSQADLEAKNAESIKKAINVLEKLEN